MISVSNLKKTEAVARALFVLSGEADYIRPDLESYGATKAFLKAAHELLIGDKNQADLIARLQIKCLERGLEGLAARLS